MITQTERIEEEKGRKIVKVRGNTNPRDAATALYQLYKNGFDVSVSSIGVPCCEVALLVLSKAKEKSAIDGKTLYFIPYHNKETVKINTEDSIERTSIIYDVNFIDSDEYKKLFPTLEKALLFKVGRETEIGKEAGALVAYLKQGYNISLSAIGAKSIHKSIRSIIKAIGFVADEGNLLVSSPIIEYTDVVLEDKSTRQFEAIKITLSLVKK